MLVDDVKLDLVTRWKVTGRRPVGTTYFTNYDRTTDWRLVPAWLDGREVLAVFGTSGDARPRYFIALELAADQVTAIRDFRYVSYIGHEASIEMNNA